MKLKSNNLAYTALLLTTSVLFGAMVIGSLFVTTPKLLGPGGVTIWFVGLFVWLSCLFTAIIYLVQARKSANRENIGRLFKHSGRDGVIVALGVTTILGLKSLGSLNLRDVILFILTLFIVELYFRTRRSY